MAEIRKLGVKGSSVCVCVKRSTTDRSVWALCIYDVYVKRYHGD